MKKGVITKSGNTRQDKDHALRRRAELKIGGKKTADIQDMRIDDANALLHELQVHQVELEMQNEELMHANALAETALSKYYDIYNLAPIGYFTVNEQGRILEVNQASTDILEVKKRFLLNNYFQNYITDDCLGIYKTFRMEILESNTKQSCEIKLIKKNKSPIHVQIAGIIVKTNIKNEYQMWLTVVDISDRVAAEGIKEEVRRIHEEENHKLMDQMRMFDKLKTEYFSNVSHELRTPLNVILSSLKLLELKKSKLQYEDALRLDKHIITIKQNSYRLLRLINNIIDITKIESSFFEIHLKNCNIVAVIEDIVFSVVEYAEDKGIALVFDTDMEEKITACDPDIIERIILNLLSNAIKFTKPDGNINVSILDKGAAVEITVNDSGIGIPKDKQELIFQRFKQVDASLTKEYEGSGIGLSLVRSLVDMHGGTIFVQSEIGKGSQFTIILPVKILDPQERAPTDAGIQIKSQIERLTIEFPDIYSLKPK